MPHDQEEGSFSADIPADAIAEALAAVERRAARAEPPPGGPDVPVEVQVESAGATPAEQSPLTGEAERLRLELEMSQERSRKVFEQLKDEHDRLLRTAADLENYKKRAAREKDDVQRYGNERLVKDLLPVVDNLDRALAAAASGDQLVSGVEMTRRLLLDALGRFGVTSFSAQGQTFDPRLHEALMTVVTSAAAPGTVIEEQQRGYYLHERLIRPAAVVVSTAPPPAPAGAGGPPSEEP
jgi:molecular chaperone GrpE